MKVCKEKEKTRKMSNYLVYQSGPDDFTIEYNGIKLLFSEFRKMENFYRGFTKYSVIWNPLNTKFQPNYGMQRLKSSILRSYGQSPMTGKFDRCGTLTFDPPAIFTGAWQNISFYVAGDYVYYVPKEVGKDHNNYYDTSEIPTEKSIIEKFQHFPVVDDTRTDCLYAMSYGQKIRERIVVPPMMESEIKMFVDKYCASRLHCLYRLKDVACDVNGGNVTLETIDVLFRDVCTRELEKYCCAFGFY